MTSRLTHRGTASMGAGDRGCRSPAGRAPSPRVCCSITRCTSGTCWLHKVPFLWRFHRVHHCDLDMDASTGIRFHFGEMLLSVGWRAAQILLIGVSRRALSIWNALLLIEVMFHHSNVQLPSPVERRLSRVLVTSRSMGSIIPSGPTR